MDNFSLNIVSDGRDSFEKALEIALQHHTSVTHYAVIEHGVVVNEWTKVLKKRKTLVLFWCDDTSFKPKPTELPFAMKGRELFSFVWGWLEDAWTKRLHGQEPDQDGSNGNGWRIFNEDWGHVAGSHGAFVGIQPVWAMFGK